MFSMTAERSQSDVEPVVFDDAKRRIRNEALFKHAPLDTGRIRNASSGKEVKARKAMPFLI